MQNSSLSLDKSCKVKYGKQVLKEGKELSIKGKLYKVEDCHLQRAYQACGTHLWFMLNIVCGAIESQKVKPTRSLPRARRFTQEKLLSDACCENSCTVAELARYCP
ncbi:unnamed protein product [Adineta ricciae]|uniref:Insulin-like domain-containing protein n=1 Tax=Adineta ricciae TaxID=249248 RepID=A0A816HR31_ADIRI|nr:unnamed protein product [Adineta ricciae]